NNIIAVDLSKKRLERVKNHITNVETICSDVANVKLYIFFGVFLEIFHKLI
ncbi:unnamed protein product, partial [marine sediment metagenome]